jgi:hypothetical protein
VMREVTMALAVLGGITGCVYLAMHGHPVMSGRGTHRRRNDTGGSEMNAHPIRKACAKCAKVQLHVWANKHEHWKCCGCGLENGKEPNPYRHKGPEKQEAK